MIVDLLIPHYRDELSLEVIFSNILYLGATIGYINNAPAWWSCGVNKLTFNNVDDILYFKKLLDL